jgi:SM-20-related protein
MSSAGGSSPIDARGTARCPHVLYRNVLGPASVAALLDYVVLHQGRFRPAPVRNRGIVQEGVDRTRRDGLLLGDLGPLRAPIEAFVRRIARDALARLGLTEPVVEPREFEISSYGDGGHFAAHLDTTDLPDRVRILSCVYYFAGSPVRFHGGELRLHGFPGSSGEGSPPIVDVVPETDTLIAFPSWLVHQILPVRVPSAAWADRRFAINCWIHRCQ